jgi:subtilase family serine protease
MGEEAETMTAGSSRVRRHWAVAIASTISVAALMILSGVAAAGISLGSSDSMDRNANATSLFPSAETVAPLGPPDASEVPLLAAGPFQSLNLQGETGAALGGSVSSVQSVSLDQSDLVVVTLQLQHVDQLNTYLQAVSNPSSPAYAHFLTISQFAKQYAPASRVQVGVADYLSAAGLHLEYVSTDHLTVAVTGSLQQVEGAFGVQLATYTEAGQSFFAPTESPSLPATLAPWVSNIAGLTNFNVGLQPQLAYSPQLTSHPEQSNGPGAGVLDYPYQDTYEFQLNQLWNATGNASAGVQPSFAQGVVIATALWDLNNSPAPAPQYCPYSLTDIHQFFVGKTYASPSMPSELPAPRDHANYNVTGDTTQAPGTGNCTDFSSPTGPNEASEELSLEMTIDQEYSGEDAPGAMIEPTYVGAVGVTVTDAELDLLLAWIAAGNIPNLAVVSQSFGGSESTAYETYYTELAATGVTVLASSGDDNGACGYECDGQAICDTGGTGEYSWNTEGATTVDYPGTSPNVLSVGGTANMANGSLGQPSAILANQTVWNWCPSFDNGVSGGSTGGVSSVFAEPSYQKADPAVNKAMRWAIKLTDTGNFTNGLPPMGCDGCDNGSAYNATSARAVPDLGGPAADMAGYLGGTWVTGWGGTSFSSPSVAGALGSVIAFDGHKIGFFNTALYSLEQEYLDGKLSSLPFPVAPTYFVQNYSNAFFDGGKVYNTSAGWGVPQAYNIALLLGKPFISTNPQGPATSGTKYSVTAAIKDDQNVNKVNVTYLEPGSSTWMNASLHLASGSRTSGTWTGYIPASSSRGALKYCIDAVDVGQGNSWSPYNQSAWVATKGANLQFGCKTPFRVSVEGAAPGGGGVGSNDAPTNPTMQIVPTPAALTLPAVRTDVSMLLPQLSEVAAPAATGALFHTPDPHPTLRYPREAVPGGSSTWLMAAGRAPGVET